MGRYYNWLVYFLCKEADAGSSPVLSNTVVKYFTVANRIFYYISVSAT